MSEWNEDNTVEKEEEYLSPKEMLSVAPFFEIPEKPVTLTCKESCTKWLLFVFNTFFSFVSLFCMGFGTWMLTDDTTTSYLEITKLALFEPVKNANGTVFVNSAELPNTGKLIIIFIIALGGFTLLISLLGCCGVLFQKRTVIKAYAFMICLLVLLQIIGLIAASVNINQIDWNMHENMRNFVQHEYMNRGTRLENAWNDMQLGV
ncbi:DgyrCDS13582 [Dimorphilus gyrociliatus]|uniref:DgyrCDS13582 n=1 Tax=Dimorphilus gyrociliatus TaxID=2664684 RepID=A0A7I8WB35_9ANNE|nr:DgyrCDS13582 [Dimorphilus gyrociliatus]